MDDKKIAVLIDAENVSGKYIKLILDEVSNYGSATYKRLYGDFQTPSAAGVDEEPARLCDHAGFPVQLYAGEKCLRFGADHRCDGYFIFGPMWMASVSSPRTVILRSWCCACVSQA